MKTEKSLPKPWERQDNETEKQFLALHGYLDQGPGRSYANVARYMELSLTTIKRYGKLHHWKKRADAYDKYMYENAKNELLQHVEDLEQSAYNRRIKKAVFTQEAQQMLINYFNLFDHTYNNEEIKKSINFIKLVASAMSELDKIGDFSFSNELTQQRFIRDINIVNIIREYNENIRKQQINNNVQKTNNRLVVDSSKQHIIKKFIAPEDDFDDLFSQEDSDDNYDDEYLEDEASEKDPAFEHENFDVKSWIKGTSSR